MRWVLVVSVIEGLRPSPRPSESVRGPTPRFGAPTPKRYFEMTASEMSARATPKAHHPRRSHGREHQHDLGAGDVSRELLRGERHGLRRRRHVDVAARQK